MKIFEEDNKFDKLLLMKLECSPNSESNLKSKLKRLITKKEKKFEIRLLTLTFGEYKLSLPQRVQSFHLYINGTDITCALKGGELRFKITNGKILAETRGLIHKLEDGTNVKMQVKSPEFEMTGQMSQKSPILNVKVKSRSESNEYERREPNVWAKGSENETIWCFCSTEFKVLRRGGFTNCKLGDLELDSNPCSIEAQFVVNHKDIMIIPNEDRNMATNIKNRLNNLAIERCLIKDIYEYLQPDLKPYLSRIELREERLYDSVLSLISRIFKLKEIAS